MHQTAQAVDVGVLVLGQRLVGVGQSLCRCTLGVLGRVVVGLGDKALVDLGGDLVVDFLIVPITEDGFQPVKHR